jgi:hypothetical protein
VARLGGLGITSHRTTKVVLSEFLEVILPRAELLVGSKLADGRSANPVRSSSQGYLLPDLLRLSVVSRFLGV